MRHSDGPSKIRKGRSSRSFSEGTSTAGSTVRIKYLGHARRTPGHSCTPTRLKLAPKCRKPQTSYCFASGCELFYSLASSMTPRLTCCTLANKLIWSFVSRSRHQLLHQPLVLGPPSLRSSRKLRCEVVFLHRSCFLHRTFVPHAPSQSRDAF